MKQDSKGVLSWSTYNVFPKYILYDFAYPHDLGVHLPQNNRTEVITLHNQKRFYSVFR